MPEPPKIGLFRSTIQFAHKVINSIIGKNRQLSLRQALRQKVTATANIFLSFNLFRWSKKFPDESSMQHIAREAIVTEGN